VRPETRGYTTRTDVLAGLYDALTAIQVNQINRKLHAEGMDSFTGYDPQSLPRGKAGPTQQTLPPPGSPVGGFDGIADLRLVSAREGSTRAIH
jgi:hypothetical protein